MQTRVAPPAAVQTSNTKGHHTRFVKSDDIFTTSKSLNTTIFDKMSNFFHRRNHSVSDATPSSRRDSGVSTGQPSGTSTATRNPVDIRLENFKDKVRGHKKKSKVSSLNRTSRLEGDFDDSEDGKENVDQAFDRLLEEDLHLQPHLRTAVHNTLSEQQKTTLLKLSTHPQMRRKMFTDPPPNVKISSSLNKNATPKSIANCGYTHPTFPGLKPYKVRTPQQFAEKLRECSFREVEVSEVMELRVLLKTGTAEWTTEFLEAGGYNALFFVLWEMKNLKIRKAMDEKILQQVVRCIKALSTHHLGAYEILHNVYPIHLVRDLLFRSAISPRRRQPFEVATRALMLDLLCSLATLQSAGRRGYDLLCDLLKNKEEDVEPPEDTKKDSVAKVGPYPFPMTLRDFPEYAPAPPKEKIKDGKDSGPRYTAWMHEITFTVEKHIEPITFLVGNRSSAGPPDAEISDIGGSGGDSDDVSEEFTLNRSSLTPGKAGALDYKFETHYKQMRGETDRNEEQTEDGEEPEDGEDDEDDDGSTSAQQRPSQSEMSTSQPIADGGYTPSARAARRLKKKKQGSFNNSQRRRAEEFGPLVMVDEGVVEYLIDHLRLIRTIITVAPTTHPGPYTEYEQEDVRLEILASGFEKIARNLLACPHPTLLSSYAAYVTPLLIPWIPTGDGPPSSDYTPLSQTPLSNSWNSSNGGAYQTPERERRSGPHHVQFARTASPRNGGAPRRQKLPIPTRAKVPVVRRFDAIRLNEEDEYDQWVEDNEEEEEEQEMEEEEEEIGNSSPESWARDSGTGSFRQFDNFRLRRSTDSNNRAVSRLENYRPVSRADSHRAQSRIDNFRPESRIEHYRPHSRAAYRSDSPEFRYGSDHLRGSGGSAASRDRDRFDFNFYPSDLRLSAGSRTDQLRHSTGSNGLRHSTGSRLSLGSKDDLRMSGGSARSSPRFDRYERFDRIDRIDKKGKGKERVTIDETPRLSRFSHSHWDDMDLYDR